MMEQTLQAEQNKTSRGTLIVLVALGLAVFVIANDFTAMGVALTRIEHDFNSDVQTVQWVINAYALVFGVLIVFCGKLADMFGEHTGSKRLDYAGVGVLSLALVAVLLALDQVNAWGFADIRIIVLFAICAVLLAAFPFVERRAGEQALLPAALARNREFMAACVSVLLLFGMFFTCLVYLPEFMQKILGYSALAAGLGLLPLMAVYALVSFAAGTLYEHLGAKTITASGAACMTIGILLLSFLTPNADYGSIIAGMIVLGIGIGLFLSSVTTAGVTALPPSQASLASGVLYLFQVTGGSLGLGLVTAVFISGTRASVFASGVSRQLTLVQQHALMKVLVGTDTVRQLRHQFPATVAHLEYTMRVAFAAGIHESFRIVALLGALGFLVALLFVGGRLHVWPRAARQHRLRAGTPDELSD